jgi:hypothetical protein
MAVHKVTAVNYAELSEYYDVAIFSTKGSRSLQSLLSGGGMCASRRRFELINVT